MTLQHAVEVVLMPPEDGELTDEDSEDDEELLPKDPNHFWRGVLSQQAELVIFDDDDEDTAAAVALAPLVSSPPIGQKCTKKTLD